MCFPSLPSPLPHLSWSMHTCSSSLVPDTTAVQCLWLQIISLKPDSHSAGCKLLTSSIYECQIFQGGKGGRSRVEGVPLNGIHQPYHIYKLIKRLKWSSLGLAGSSSTSWFYEILIETRHVSVLESGERMILLLISYCPVHSSEWHLQFSFW